jgi:hypothetical protein
MARIVNATRAARRQNDRCGMQPPRVVARDLGSMHVDFANIFLEDPP